MAKKTSGTKGESPKRAKTTPNRTFPRYSLNEALEVALAIKKHNGGNAWKTEEVSKAVGLTSKSQKFYYLTAAARDYGITIGTRETEFIELTDLGRNIVYAPNPEEEIELKKSAFLNVNDFKNVLDYYKGSDLPEMTYLSNTLESQFNIPPEHHDDFSKLFKENCDDLDLDSEENSGDVTSLVDSPKTVLVGEPKGSQEGKPKAFVIMPFTERSSDRPKGFFSEALRNLITPAAVNAGFRVETANRKGSDIIQSTIINELLEADLVIADLTDHNPNVLFELGLRMAEDKPVALIKTEGTSRIFDVDNMIRVLEYNSNLWKSSVEKDLPKLEEHIKASWEGRASKQSYMKILRRQMALAA